MVSSTSALVRDNSEAKRSLTATLLLPLARLLARPLVLSPPPPASLTSLRQSPPPPPPRPPPPLLLLLLQHDDAHGVKRPPASTRPFFIVDRQNSISFFLLFAIRACAATAAATAASGARAVERAQCFSDAMRRFLLNFFRCASFLDAPLASLSPSGRRQATPNERTPRVVWSGRVQQKLFLQNHCIFVLRSCSDAIKILTFRRVFVFHDVDDYRCGAAAVAAAVAFAAVAFTDECARRVART